MDLRAFWAKTEPFQFQSVVTHGYVSGGVCRYLVENYLSDGIRTRLAKLLILSEEELADFMAYLTSLHDIGKIEYHFQCMSPEMKEKLRELGIYKERKDRYRHEKTGATAARKIWREQKQNSFGMFSDIIGAHHQKDHGVGAKTDPFFEGLQTELE